MKKFLLNIYEAYCHEFKLLLHDAGIILFCTFLPLVYPIVYSLIYNPELVKDVAMVVVDNDRTPLSRELVRKMDACDQARVIGYAANLSEARHAMDSHKCFAILEIPEGFERSNGRFETSDAALYCDASLLLRYRGFLMAATNVMEDFGSELMTKNIDQIAPLSETMIAGDLLPIRNVSMGNIRNGFDSFVMPGVLILIIQQCIILAVGMAGGAKRERYRMHTSDSGKEKRPVFLSMVAQTVCYLTVLILPILFMIHFVPLIFHFPMKGDILEISAYLTPMIIACFGIGFTLQLIVTERESVFVLWVVTSLIFLLLSGLIWPLYDMPPVWRVLASVCPSTWGVQGFVNMNANGSSISQLSDQYINLWLVAVGWWIVGYCVCRWVARKSMVRLRENN